MGWLWYVFVVVGVLFTLFAYRTKRAIKRMNADDIGPFGRVLATQFGVTAAASLALGIVLAFTLSADPGTAVLRENIKTNQLALHQSMGRVLGKELAKIAKPDSKALIIYRELEDSEDEYSQAIIQGLQEEFGNRIEISRRHALEPDDGLEGVEFERDASRCLTLTASELDNIADQNSDCNVIISLVDITPAYVSTDVAGRVSTGQAMLGLYTRNPYLLGGAISAGQITYAIIPKRNVRHDLLPADTPPRQRFDQHFHLVNHENIKDIWKLNKKLFYVIQRPD